MGGDPCGVAWGAESGRGKKRLAREARESSGRGLGTEPRG